MNTTALRQAIYDHALAVLRRAEGNAVSQADLAVSIKHTVPGCAEWGLDTCRRRVKESMAYLVCAGHPVVSDRRGYRLDPSPVAMAEARRFIGRQIAALGTRLRALGAIEAAGRADQLALDLGVTR